MARKMLARHELEILGAPKSVENVDL